VVATGARDGARHQAACLGRRSRPRCRLDRHAYAKLAPLEATRAGKPRFDYLFGLAALDSSHVTHAIFALERVLAMRPNDHPAKAKLARA